MFCHNDYSVGSEPYIIIYDDRFELITYGGLPQGLTEEEFFNAKSLPRNRELMKIMNNLDMGEHIGRGMRRIMNHLKKEDFEISENFLTINFKYDKSVLLYLNKNKVINDEINGEINDEINLSKNAKLVLVEITKNSYITRKELSNKISKSERTIDRAIKELKDKGYINEKENNNKKNGKWVIIKKYNINN